MFPICYICLRSNVKLLSVDEDLENLYDEICEFSFVSDCQFCLECATKLKKLNDFKKSCHAAIETLKAWKRQKKSAKKSIDLLYLEIPVTPSRLSFCDKKNFKVFTYHSADLDTAPIEIPATNHPYIITVNIPDTENTCNSEFTDTDEKDTSKDMEFAECIEMFENDDTETVENYDDETEYLEVKDESDLSDSAEPADGEEDSDSSIKELISEFSYKNLATKSLNRDIKQKRVSYTEFSVNHLNENINEDNKRTRISNKEFSVDNLTENINGNYEQKRVVYEVNVDDLKKLLKEKFEEYGTVKDGKGAVVDVDTVLNNLDTFSLKHLNNVNRLCSGQSSNPSIRDLVPTSSRYTGGNDSPNSYDSNGSENSEINDSDQVKTHNPASFSDTNTVGAGDTLTNIKSESPPENLCKKCQKDCQTSTTEPGPLTPLAISKLADIQSRNSVFESLISMEYLKDQTQVLAEFERRRLYQSYVERKYRCESCIKGFRYAKLLEYHNKTQHNQSLPFECALCRMRFRTKRAVSKHTPVHATIYKCKLCPNYVSNNRCSVMIHYNKHKGLKYRCRFCGREFSMHSALYTHYNLVHSQRACELCARNFVNPVGLSQHKRLKHHGEHFVESEDNKKCEECNITFITEAVYQKHLCISHRNDDRGREERRRSREKNYVYSTRRICCRVCKWEGHSSWDLIQHFTKDHPTEDMGQIYGTNKYLCPYCGKGFGNSTSCNDHMNTHTGAKPYACSKCPKKFHSKMNLNVHVLRHLPPTRKCPHCEKMFATAGGLSSHVKTHVRDRRYKCEICSKGFIHSVGLREHVRGVHLNIKRKKNRAVAK